MTIALFNKDKGGSGKQADIDSLKKRFSQLQKGQGGQGQQQAAQQPPQQPQQNQSQAPPQQPAQPRQPSQQQPQHPQQPPQQPAQPRQPLQQQGQQPQSPQQPQQTPVQQPPQQPSQQPPQQQPQGQQKSPLEALQGQQQTQQAQGQQQGPVSFVEVEGNQGNVVNQATIDQQNASGAQQPQEGSGQEAQGGALKDDQQDPQQTQDSAIEESLEDLKEDYDDAKLNSIIIEQVKELIEIDTNLNNKIEDVRADLKKETQEREKLQKQMETHYSELKELEKSIDKFIALYELVTNQFNPFVKQDDPESKQKMQEMMGDVHAKQQGMQPKQGVAQTDFHFVTKTGARVKNLPELVGMLENMDDAEFQHHVTDDKNDFATWIQEALKNQELAQKIQPLKSRQEIVAALKEACEEQKGQPEQKPEQGGQQAEQASGDRTGQAGQPGSNQQQPPQQSQGQQQSSQGESQPSQNAQGQQQSGQ